MILRYETGVCHLDNLSMTVQNEIISLTTILHGEKICICTSNDFLTNKHHDALEQAVYRLPVPVGMHVDVKSIIAESLLGVANVLATTLIDQVAAVLLSEKTSGKEEIYTIARLFAEASPRKFALENGKLSKCAKSFFVIR